MGNYRQANKKASRYTKFLVETQNLGIRIKDKVILKEIFRKTKAKRVSGITKMLKIGYVGYIIREPIQKWNNIMTTWVPYSGKCVRGRLRKRWSDEITPNFGIK